MPLRKDFYFSAFCEAAIASFIPEAVNSIGDYSPGALLGAELLIVWYEKICHGGIYCSLPFCNSWSFNILSHVFLVSWGKKRRRKNRVTIEEELKSLTAPYHYSFEVLFMNCSISSILGIKYTIEGVCDVVYSPEPRRSWNIEVINVL